MKALRCSWTMRCSTFTLPEEVDVPLLVALQTIRDISSLFLATFLNCSLFFEQKIQEQNQKKCDFSCGRVYVGTLSKLSFFLLLMELNSFFYRIDFQFNCGITIVIVGKFKSNKFSCIEIQRIVNLSLKQESMPMYCLIWK